MDPTYRANGRRLAVARAMFVLSGAFASSAVAQQPPSIHPLGRVVASSAAAMRPAVVVRELPDGSVLVQESSTGKLVLLDKTLSSPRTLYQAQRHDRDPSRAVLAGYKGDSAVFFDVGADSLVIVDPLGKVIRIDGAPTLHAATFLRAGAVAVDRRGFAVYQVSLGPADVASVGPRPPSLDSMPLLRVDLASHRVDTLATLNVQSTDVRVVQDPSGGRSPVVFIDPLPFLDDWAMLSDGTVALVRGQDFRIDWLAPNLKPSASPPISYSWEKLTQPDKQRIVDSVKAAEDSARSRTDQALGRLGAAPRSEVASMLRRHVAGLPAEDLPDRRPAFRTGGIRVDLENRLWVPVTLPAKEGGTVYYVIDRRGAVVDRLQVPKGRILVGFGRSSTVYLSSSTPGIPRLERLLVR